MRKILVIAVLVSVLSIFTFGVEFAITSVSPFATFGGMSAKTSEFKIVFQYMLTQIDFSIQNLSEKPITIFWDQCSYIDPDNVSHRIIHKGIRYIMRDQPMPPTIIPPTSTINDLIAPTDKIKYTDGYYSETILDNFATGTKFGIMLTLRVGNKKKTSYVFRFTIVKGYKETSSMATSTVASTQAIKTTEGTPTKHINMQLGLGANSVSIFGASHISPKLYGDIQFFLMKDFLIGAQFEYPFSMSPSFSIDAEYKFDIKNMKPFVGLNVGMMFGDGVTVPIIGAYGGVSYPIPTLSNLSAFLKGSLRIATMSSDGFTLSVPIISLTAGMGIDF